MKKNDPKKRPAAADREIQAVLDGIRKIVRGLRHAALDAERRHGLSGAQLFVLNALAGSAAPLSVNELARRTLTHQSSVSVVASKLVARGYARKQRSAADSRRVDLAITEVGRRALGRKPDLVQDRLISAVRTLPPAARKGLIEGLRAVLAASGLDREAPSLFFEEKDRKNVAR